MSVSWSSNDGDSWQRVQLSDTGPAAVWALAVAASNTAIVYAGGHVNYAGAIRRSTDFGRTWAETPAPNGRVWGLAVHPDDENTVYAAALDSCWKTTDAGATWRRVGGGYYLYNVCLYPGSPDTVIVGGRYGVAISTDGGTTWQQFNTGLTSTSVTCLRIVDDNGAVRLYAGTAGGGLHVYSSTWRVPMDKGWVFFVHSERAAVLTGIDGPQDSYGMDPNGPGTMIQAHCRRCASHLGHILIVDGRLHRKRRAFSSVVRRRDNALHRAAAMAAELLQDLGVTVTHLPLARSAWRLEATFGEAAGGTRAMEALGRYTQRLVERHGEPKYIGRSRYRGEAYARFARADMSDMENEARQDDGTG